MNFSIFFRKFCVTPVVSHVLRGKSARGYQKMYQFAHARRLTAVLAFARLLLLEPAVLTTQRFCRNLYNEYELNHLRINLFRLERKGLPMLYILVSRCRKVNRNRSKQASKQGRSAVFHPYLHLGSVTTSLYELKMNRLRPLPSQDCFFVGYDTRFLRLIMASICTGWWRRVRCVVGKHTLV